MNRRTRVAAGVLIIGLLVGSFFLLAVTGYAVFSPQLTYFVGPGFNANPGGGGDVWQAFRDFQQPPTFAILREWPNGSWSAQVWVYNPNTLPMRGFVVINLIPPNNGTSLWWGAFGHPHTPGTGETSNVVCPFTWGYTDVWTWINGTVGVEPPTSTVSPPGFFRWLNEPGWNASIYISMAYPVGGVDIFERFVYVGNHTWVATPATTQEVLPPTSSPFLAYPQEIPPDFPYRNLVTDINNGPLPSWWGHPGLSSCP